MPTCGALTAGPSDESHEAVTVVGVAAHIHAAAPKGRRYDTLMTPAERKNIRNGIWLCATHSVEIDRDEVRYSADVLRKMKCEHEAAIANELNAGRGTYFISDLIAIGPDIVGVGDLIGTSGSQWAVRILHFAKGDLRALITFSEKFDSIDPFDRFLIVNAVGEGRQFASAPSWKRTGTSIEISCIVKAQFPRVDAQKLGMTITTNPANDLFFENGNLATVSGLDSLPERIKGAISMLQGESIFYPKVGSLIKEYFDELEDSPWLLRWMKLEVARLSCIPYEDPGLKTSYTLLPSVISVDSVELLASDYDQNWKNIRLKLHVQGVGLWEHVVPVFVPKNEEAFAAIK